MRAKLDYQLHEITSRRTGATLMRWRWGWHVPAGEAQSAKVYATRLGAQLSRWRFERASSRVQRQRDQTEGTA